MKKELNKRDLLKGLGGVFLGTVLSENSQAKLLDISLRDKKAELLSGKLDTFDVFLESFKKAVDQLDKNYLEIVKVLMDFNDIRQKVEENKEEFKILYDKNENTDEVVERHIVYVKEMMNLKSDFELLLNSFVSFFDDFDIEENDSSQYFLIYKNNTETFNINIEKPISDRIYKLKEDFSEIKEVYEYIFDIIEFEGGLLEKSNPEFFDGETEKNRFG